MAVINWKNQTENEQGTPVDRKRLMGMQGFYPSITTITKESDTITRIEETSEEGVSVTTIRTLSSYTRINEVFTATDGTTIRQVTIITKRGDVNTITESTTG